MKKLLSAAALSVGVVACRAPAPEAAVVAEPPAKAVKREEVVLQRVSNVVEAEPMPSDCNCTAGNGKVPRQVPGDS